MCVCPSVLQSLTTLEHLQILFYQTVHQTLVLQFTDSVQLLVKTAKTEVTNLQTFRRACLAWLAKYLSGMQTVLNP